MGQWILGAALLLGIVGDALFQGAGGAGLNWLFFAVAAIGAAAMLARRGAVKTAPGGRFLMGLALAFSALMPLRDSPALQALCLLAIVVATAGAVSSQEGWRAFQTGFLEYARSVAKLAVAGFIGPTRLPREARAPAEGAGTRWKAAPGVARGLLIVSPLFCIFLCLLMAADPAYQYSVQHLFDWDISTLVLRLLIVAVIAWCAAGILHRALQSAAAPGESPAHAPLQALGLPEVVTILAAIDLLFLSFVAVQARYAFGGPALIKATTGLTFAQYARGGFFELLAVAAIVLPVLLFLHWSTDRATPRGEGPFRWLAAVQVALLFVMLASAFRRMGLYEEAYGLTELRLYVMAAIVWLAVVFAWFGLTVLRGRRELFAGGAVAAAAIGIAILEALNPDALIARANLVHAQSAQRFDGCYASSLGADAVPPLVAALPTLPPADAAIVASQLLKHWTPPAHIDWRGWTFGRAQAWNAVESHKPQMTALAQGAPADACTVRDDED